MLNVVHLSRNEMGQSLDDDDGNDIQIDTRMVKHVIITLKLKD